MLSLTEQNRQDFETKGFCIIEGQISDTLRHTLIEEFEKLNQGNPKWFLHGPHTISDVFAQFVQHPIFIEACQKLIGPNADLHWDLIGNKPPRQGKSFPWHQDGQYGPTKPDHYITCWIALDNATQQNGCVWALPGSHRSGRVTHKSIKETDEFYPGLMAQQIDEETQVPLEMSAGQIAIFHSNMIHRSGPNRTDKPRRSYICAYHHPDLIYTTKKGMRGVAVPILRANKPVAAPK